ncbi:MAG: GNAT family N-acetyltransferase [Clostridia bacterium]|nr:GNAT family N-acetyltransferase [Clostridia bacterium]
MATINWASPEEKHEIIDFIDYVFSKAHRPHDFSTLLPKLYGEQGDAAGHHIVVREEGKIAATLLCYPVTLYAGGREYLTLGIGSVSTHPRARGRGYLGGMMALADQRAKEMGAAFAVLGGQRQRYQYYGFDHGGYQLRAQLEQVNVRHALRDVMTDGLEIAAMTQAHVPMAMTLMERQPCFCVRGEEAFLSILRSWYNEPFVLFREGAFAGYGALRRNPHGCHVAELLLENESDFPAVMKLLSGIHGDLTICAAPWQRARAKWLAAVCEEYGVSPAGMIKVYDQAQTDEICRALDGFMGVAQPLYVAPPDAV